MIELRSFQPSDTNSLLALFRETVQEINKNDYSSEQLNAWTPAHPDVVKWQERLTATKTVVAVEDERILGFGNLESDRKSIGMLYVHKDFQGKGIGSMLLNKLEHSLEKRLVSNVRVEASTTARSFFEQKGYQLMRENRKSLNGVEFKNFILEKRLSLEEPEVVKNKEEKVEKKAKKDKKEKVEKKEMKEKTKKKKSLHWGDLLIQKAFDLIIVIVGVSIAFQLNNLKLQTDQKAQQRFYLEGMVSDLDKDMAKVDEIVVGLKSDRAWVQSYFAYTEPRKPSADSLAQTIANLFEFETFRGHQDTYTTLLSGNGLSTITDPAIRNQITEYYKLYISIERFEKVYTEVLYLVNQHFSPYCDYAHKKIVDETVIGKVQTSNILLMTMGQLNNGVEDYTEMLSKAKSLKSNIEAALENPK